MHCHRVLLFAFVATFSALTLVENGIAQVSEREAEDNDWFMLQRVYPKDDIDPRLYEQARAQIKSMAESRPQMTVPVWSSVGPSNIGGRISCLLLHPTNANLIYAGAAAGGVWKSTDNGTTWSNVFNESYSIGSMNLDPTNPEVIYVGTGEANPGGVAIYPGNGIWRSTNAGATWTNLGLGATGHIGRIAIHASNPSRIFAAALGHYRSRTDDRGIYRTTDAGTSWQRVLFINDTTGACDVIIDPTNANRVIAAVWSRHRPMNYSILNSARSGLWLSTNGGDTWTQITNGFPANDASIGRTSLAVAPSQPNVMYALCSNGTGVRGVFRSSDAGASWTSVSPSFSSEGQVWYNNVITVHPTNPNLVYAGMTYLYRTANGGTSWSTVAASVHVDFHAIEFDQSNPNRMVLGSDGGVFVSTNGGSSWVKSLNLPISQFYAGTLDYTNPQRYFGGLQDNGTVRTLTGSSADWTGIYGGDGFYVLVDPTNPNRVYAESQNGGLAYSTSGGTSFFNGTSGIGGSDRKNWCTPIAMDMLNTLTLYTGTHRVYKTVNGMQSWTAISNDLTRGDGGRIGTITTIDVAPSNSSVIYVGTDDGKVQVTTNGGTQWNDVTGSLPNRWVTRISVDPDSANVCYVTISGYMQYAFQAHVYRTTNYGQTWSAIGGNLPDIPLNDILVDRTARPRLYVASDAGVLYSTNYGATWNAVGIGLPTVPVHDIAFHPPTRKLLAFTHGRSAWAVDVSSLTDVAHAERSLPDRVELFPNYPNPFNPSTTINYQLPATSYVTLEVLDVLGREVATLVSGVEQPGRKSVMLDGSRLAGGMYVYRLQAGNYMQSRKLMLVK
ncbi:MAG: T9SS type A sorting domain-containing protein [Ignavibacteriae bacterium]|nr:T9SS type A sorting domain-containing protein [Ignavibacteriota bacterium]